MLMKSLTVAVGLLAPAVHTFLIPPQLSESDVQIAETIEAVPSIADKQVINLECPGCPILVAGEDGSLHQMQTHRPTHLELTFSIDHGPDGDRLLLNNYIEMYPKAQRLRTPRIHTPFTVPQAFDKDDKRDQHHGEHDDEHHKKHPHHGRPDPLPQRLSFGFGVGAGHKDAEGAFELIEINFAVQRLGRDFTFAGNNPSVKLNLIKESSGKLLMAKIENTTPQTPVYGPEEECSTVYCSWLAAAREKVEKLRKMKGFGCHGHMKGGEGAPPPPPHHGVDGHHPHHSHDGPHHHSRPAFIQGDERVPPRELTWGRLLKNITRHILLPVFIGIIAGVSVSLIGMAVGTAVVSLWRFFFRRKSSSTRRHSRRHSCHKASHKEAAIVADEKAGLMAVDEVEDLPPAYKDDDDVKKPAEA